MTFKDYIFEQKESGRNEQTHDFASPEDIRKNPPKWANGNAEAVIELFACTYLLWNHAFGSEWVNTDEEATREKNVDNTLTRINDLGTQIFDTIKLFGPMLYYETLSMMFFYGWMKRLGNTKCYALDPRAKKAAEENGFLGLL